jgi:hypothetical protein
MWRMLTIAQRSASTDCTRRILARYPFRGSVRLRSAHQERHPGGSCVISLTHLLTRTYTWHHRTCELSNSSRGPK